MNKSFTLLLISASVFFVGCGNNADSANNKTKASDTTSVQQTAAIKTILFFGNSLTAGYGLEQSQAFPALIQEKLDSLQLPYKTINAGVSGETSSGGNSRIDWILRQPVDVFVLELGANDGLRGIPVAETRKNLQSIIDKVKAKYPQVKIVLAGMQVPPNMGAQYAAEFRNMYPELAQKNGAALIPFLLEGVGGEAKLNLEDGIHPTAEGHQIVTETIWKFYKINCRELSIPFNLNTNTHMYLKGPIIIVEDDLEDREIMQEIFNELNIANEIRFFNEGSGVLDYLRNTKQKPFLILTDVNMPGVSGLELREQIIQDDYLRRKSIPFVFLSTSDGSGIINRIYDLQVQGYFQKQTSFPEIKKQIKLIVDYWTNCKHPNN